MKRSATLLLLLMLQLSFVVHAQQQTIQVRITGVRQQPLPYATLSWFTAQDSSLLGTFQTDTSGNALLPAQPGTTYRIRISSVGYQPLAQSIKVTAGKNLYVFSLQPDAKALSGVVVTATKPLVRQEDDKTIIDPEPLAAASTNAYEILEKTPGIFADQDGNIFLSSTTPATIYINGREQKMNNTDIATLLKSLPPGSIASIEVLRTPSARFDASGGGGIVNVVLKKGVRIGLTGSLSAGMNQGRYGNQFAGITINNTKGAWSTFLNVQGSLRNSYEQLTTDRAFAPDSLLRQQAFTRYPGRSAFVTFGATYSTPGNWELGYDGRLTLNSADNSSNNFSDISTLNPTRTLAANVAHVQTHNKGLVLSQGLTAKKKWGTESGEWSSDLSYTTLPSTTEQQFVTEYLQPQKTSLPGNGTLERTVHQLQAQTNLTQKLPAGIRMEAGLKTTNVWFGNNAAFFYRSGGRTIPNPGRSAQYDYTEHIHAAYLQGSRNFSGIVVKLGTRLEHTRMDGQQALPYDTAFRLQRTDLFPYIYISRALMKIAGYDLKAYLVARRTITRPAYENLNPAPRYVDPYLLDIGNPGLRPQFNRNYEANISVDERPIVAIGWNDTKDIFSQVIYQADSTRAVSYRTFDNLGSNKEFYFRALGAIPPGKRYFFVLGVQYNRNQYKGTYEAKPINFDRGSWTVFTYHSLKLDKQTQVSLNGFARFKGQLQFYELSSFGTLNLSVNRQFLNKKLNVGLSATDLFFTNNNSFVLQQGTVNARGWRKGDTRRVGLTLRYNFGIRKKEDNGLLNLMNTEPAANGN